MIKISVNFRKKLYISSLMVFMPFLMMAREQITHLDSDTRVFTLQKLYKEDVKQYKIEFRTLENELKSKKDKESLFVLYDYHYQNISTQGNYDSLLTLLHTMRALNANSSDSELIPLYLQLASVFHYKANLDSLSFWQEKAGKLLDENSAYYSQYLLNEGLKSQLNADFTNAIQSIIQATTLFEKEEDWSRLAVAYNNLAFNYERLGNYDAHVEYLFRAVALNKKEGNSYNLAMNYNNLGLSFREKDRLVEAVAFYDSAFQELKKVNSPLLLAQNLMNRANIFKRKGDLTNAEPLFLQSLAICEENNIVYGKMLCMLNLGDLYRQQRRFDVSMEYLENTLELSKILKSRREESLVYERFAWVARDKGDYKGAYDWQTKYYLLNDSLANESVKKEANALREKYDTEKKEREILMLSRQKLTQQLIIAALVIGVLILVVLLQWWRTKLKLMNQEKEKQVMRRKHLREILESKDKELTAQAAQLLQMHQLLEIAKTNVAEILSDTSLEHSRVRKIKTALSKNSVLEVKNDFDLRITESNKDFFNILLKAYPSLKPAELKLCAYLRLNLSTKEISEITNKSVRTVENIRLAVRKKMELNPSDNLVSHLISLELENEVA